MSEHHRHRHHREHAAPELDPRRSPFDQPRPEHPREDHHELTRPVEHETAAALLSTNEYAQDISRYLHRLGVLAERRDTPADMRTIVLTAGAPKFTDQVGNLPARSIGIINPSTVTVFLGLGGGVPSSTGRTPSVPPSAAAVFPVMALDLEVAADPAGLGAGDAVVYLFRYPSVQTAHFSRIA